jgi:hypothetical protein
MEQSRWNNPFSMNNIRVHATLKRPALLIPGYIHVQVYNKIALNPKGEGDPGKKPDQGRYNFMTITTKPVAPSRAGKKETQPVFTDELGPQVSLRIEKLTETCLSMKVNYQIIIKTN